MHLDSKKDDDQHGVHGKLLFRKALRTEPAGCEYIYIHISQYFYIISDNFTTQT